MILSDRHLEGCNDAVLRAIMAIYGAEEMAMKVLIAIEDHAFGEAIIDYVAKQKWNAETEFDMVHVLQAPYAGEIVSEICCAGAAQLLDEEREYGRQLLMDMDLRLIKALPQAKTEQRLLIGNAKQQLLEEVEQRDIELLILGSHGRSGIGRFLLGSVSSALVAQAPCTVIVVKMPKGTKANSDAQNRSAEQSKPVEGTRASAVV